jgi:hypothetical protein
MNFQQNNRLLDSYRNNTVAFSPNSNALLQNNPIFNMNPHANPNQLMQLKMMQQQQTEEINKQRRIQEMKQAEKLKKIEKSFDPKKAKDVLIGTVKVDTDKDKDFELKYRAAQKDYPSEQKKYWEERTNQPYKNIIKDEKAIRTFLDRPRAESKEQQDELKRALVIHKVTNADKVGVNQKFQNLQGTLEKQDDELKMIYSASKYDENFKKFEYNHVYKYRMGNTKGKDHEDIKKDAITKFKKAQQKEEELKDKRDEIIESLLEQGIFDETDVMDLGYDKNKSVTEPAKQVEIKIENKEVIKQEPVQQNIMKVQHKPVVQKPVVQKAVEIKPGEHRQSAAPRPGIGIKPKMDTKVEDNNKKTAQKRGGRTIIV